MIIDSIIDNVIFGAAHELENQSEDKHVESVLLPRSDTGSNPVNSTTFFDTI